MSFEEREGGSLRFWHGEHELSATAYPKDHGVPQGEIVENKRLSTALGFTPATNHSRFSLQQVTCRRASASEVGGAS